MDFRSGAQVERASLGRNGLKQKARIPISGLRGACPCFRRAVCQPPRSGGREPQLIFTEAVRMLVSRSLHALRPSPKQPRQRRFIPPLNRPNATYNYRHIVALLRMQKKRNITSYRCDCCLRGLWLFQYLFGRLCKHLAGF